MGTRGTAILARMAANKTLPTGIDPHEFIASVAHPTRRADAQALLEMMEEVTGEPATMWGPTIIGFGAYHYKYDSGREGDAPAIGFSPPAANLSLYVLTDSGKSKELLARLGKHERGAACLYVNKLADIDFEVLTELARHGFEYTMSELHHP